MQYNINPVMVGDIMKEVNSVLTQKKVLNVEVLIALQELVGRTIAQMCATEVQANPLTALCHKHLDDTVRVGFDACKDQHILRV